MVLGEGGDKFLLCPEVSISKYLLSILKYRYTFFVKTTLGGPEPQKLLKIVANFRLEIAMLKFYLIVLASEHKLLVNW